jgi:hypothetical protein
MKPIIAIIIALACLPIARSEEEKPDPSILVIPGSPGCGYEVITNFVGIYNVQFGSKNWKGVPGQYSDQIVTALSGARIYAKKKGGDAVIDVTLNIVPFSDAVINTDSVSKAIGVVTIFGTVVKLKRSEPEKKG